METVVTQGDMDRLMSGIRQDRIDWKLDDHDRELVGLIVDRALAHPSATIDPLDLEMDLTACHLNNERKLDLQKLLEFDEFNFWHDITGISNHLDRNTGRLTNHFLPRCTAPREEPVE